MNSKNRRTKRNLLQSPVPPHLLQNSERISDEQYNLALSAISRVKTELTRLQELDNLEGESEATYRHRIACEEFIQKHQPLLHWTRRVTPEILSDIFTWCIVENHNHTPWNISQVCRRWRIIALATPQLWRRIPFIERFSDINEERQFINFLSDQYLPRSGGESIVFSWHPWHQLANELLQVLLRCAERWGDVHLAIDQRSQDLQHHISNLEGRLQSLSALKLTITNKSGNTSIKAFQSAPKLRYFALNDTRSGDDAPVLTTEWPWNQVTHISISLQPGAHTDYYHSLSSFKNLVYLHLHWLCDVTGRPTPPTAPTEHIPKAIIFRSCKYLHLGYPPGSVQDTPFFDILRNMHFPILEHLFISYDVLKLWYIDPLAIPELASFIGRHKDRNITQLKSFHWHRNCGFLSPPPLAPPTHQGRSVFRELPASLPVLRITLPSRHLLERLFKALSREDDFMIGLQKLDLGVNASVLSSAEELDWFCEMLNGLLRVPARRLDEIRIQLIPVSPLPPKIISPWELVFKLDGWDNKLRADVEQTPGDIIDQSNGRARTNNSVLLDTSSEPGQIARLRRSLVQFMHSDTVLSQKLLQSPPGYKTETINRWLKKFDTDVTTRQWTTMGSDSVLYISPESAIRETESLWVFGVKDHDIAQMDYIDYDHVPDVDPSWLNVQDLTKCRKSFRWSGEVR